MVADRVAPGRVSFAPVLASAAQLPYLTESLPGTGGVIRAQPEDFRVVEIPAYAPAGEGDHVLATIEKRDLTTFEAVKRLAHALDVAPGDIGTAGLKDRRAVTEQQVSLPPPCAPEDVTALAIDGVRVVRADRHPHKLRTGHLRGNRFTLLVRDTDVAAGRAAERAAAILEALSRAPGSPNWYGAQRFGHGGGNPAAGRALVLGERAPGRPPRGKRRRLLISAYQSLLFNEYLRRRIADGLYRAVIDGDILEKRSGGLFVTDGAAVDQPRVDAGEVAPTGPMFGGKMKAPPPGTEAAEREAAVLSADGIAAADFARAGKLAPGTRRVIGVSLGETSARAVGEAAVEICFQLPAGAYATAVLSEIVKGTTC